MVKRWYIVIEQSHPVLREMTPQDALDFTIAGGPFDTKEQAEAHLAQAFPKMDWN